MTAYAEPLKWVFYHKVALDGCSRNKHGLTGMSMPTDLEEERRKAKAEHVRVVQAEIERQQELCKVMNIAALLDVQMEAAVASLQQETYSWRLPAVHRVR